MLIISDLSELLALNKLLRKVKFSASLDSEDLEEFAASPLLAAITQRVGEEFLNKWHQQYPSAQELQTVEQQANWLKESLKAIEQRVTEWPEAKVLTVRQWNRAQVTEIAEVYLTPAAYSDGALNRLVDFILHRVRPASTV